AKNFHMRPPRLPWGTHDRQLSGTPSPSGARVELELRADQRLRGSPCAGPGVEGRGCGGGVREFARPFRAAGDSRPKRDPPLGISSNTAPDAGAFAKKYPDARPLYLPVLSAHLQF